LAEWKDIKDPRERRECKLQPNLVCRRGAHLERLVKMSTLCTGWTRSTRHCRRYRGFVGAGVFWVLMLQLVLQNAFAQDKLGQPIRIDIAADTRLEDALIDWGTLAGVTVMMSTPTVDFKIAKRVQGMLSARHALSLILRNSGLGFTENEGLIRIVPLRPVVGLEDPRGATERAADVQKSDMRLVADTTDSTSEARRLETVLVTAQKREENIQDVPASLTVLSSDALTNTGALQLADFVKDVPGLNLVNAGGPGIGELVMRGITTGADQSSPVGVYLDEVSFSPSSPVVLAGGFSFDPDLADIDRVEVLKGPQGTLYGANAVGGLVKFVTKRPEFDRTEGTIRVDGSQIDGGGAGYGIRGSANIPLIEDALALRGAFFYRKDPGFIENAANGERDINSAIVKGGRLTLRLRITNDLETTFSGLVQNIDIRNPTGVYLDPITLAPLYGPRALSTPFNQPTHTEYRSGSDTTKFEMSFATLTNILSYSGLRADNTSDFSVLGQAVGLRADEFTAFLNGSHSDRYTEELRLESKPGRLEWLGGVFYTYESDVNPEILTGTDSTGAPLPTSDPNSNVYMAKIDASFREAAVFGDLTFHITDVVEATGGIRYSKNRQSEHWNSSGLLSALTYNTTSVFYGPEVTSTDHAATYLGTVSYKPRNDVTLYVRAASGYRPGGPNVLNATEVAGGAQTAYKSDYLWNYEAGVKGTLPSGMGSYSASLFHLVWTDIQLSEQIGQFVVVGNGTHAKSDGVEAALHLRPIDNLAVSLSGAYVNARFTSDAPSLGATSGDPLPNVSKGSVASSVDYYFPKPNYVAPRVGLTYSYRSAQRSGYSNGLTLPLHPYGILDFRAGFDWSRYSLLAKIDNITNKYGMNSIGIGGAANAPVGATIIRPRTYGITLQAKF